MPSSKINDRALAILKNIIERYIQFGQPVGSKTLAQESRLMLSSASIRSIMADLEEAGLLCSPHASAGRVPTQQGYRLFVDHLLTIQPMARREIEQLQQQLYRESEPDKLISQVSTLLSGVTHLVGVVTLPKRDQLLLQHVEFLPLSDQRVLVILVINDREVQNRVIHVQRDYSRVELERAGNFLTQQFAGQDLTQVRARLFAQLQMQREGLEEMLTSVMNLAEQFERAEQQNDFVLAGEANLLGTEGQPDIGHLRQLFEAFAQKRDILHLLDQSLNARGIQIFIGEESGHGALVDYSMVTAPYKQQGKTVGVLGVIGPTRMAYSTVVSTVDITAKILSEALKSK